MSISENDNPASFPTIGEPSPLDPTRLEVARTRDAQSETFRRETQHVTAFEDGGQIAQFCLGFLTTMRETKNCPVELSDEQLLRLLGIALGGGPR